jgi:hypothetical protein
VIALSQLSAAGAGAQEHAKHGSAVNLADSRDLLATEGPPQELGAWYIPPLPPEQERMQAVHAALLPNGKVLIVNGSSNRNRLELGEIREGVDPSLEIMAGLIDNTALFNPADLPVDDPSTGKSGNDAPTGWEKIGSPPAQQTIIALPDAGDALDPNKKEKEVVDLFCSGHVHLANGNVLFVSGTRKYYPGEAFLGSRSAWTFDWSEAGWHFAGTLRDGHWYPTLVPLANGGVAVFSGVSATQQSRNSPYIEFYDPTQPVEQAWTWVNVNDPKAFPVGPFTSTIAPDSNKRDWMYNYPRIFPVQGRLMITGDGSAGGSGNAESKLTYLMSIGERKSPEQAPKISFEPGPKRDGERKSFSTGLLDPNAPGNILLLGGMQGTDDINLGPGNPLNRGNYDIEVKASLERYRAPDEAGSVGTWEPEVESFLGDKPARRMMHLGVILPNKNVLVIGGGNYAFHDAVIRPQLLRPDDDALGDYTATWMNPGTQPRLYHTTALLLPDGRVYLGGGNANRALVDLGTKTVNLDRVRTPDKTVKKNEKGRGLVPAEIWQIELFYPPYLFDEEGKPLTRDDRPRIDPENTLAGRRDAMPFGKLDLDYGQEKELPVQGMTETASTVLVKLGSVTHGFDMGQRLIDLSSGMEQDVAEGTVTVHAPERDQRLTAPPGYYMLFYVDDRGVPSEAVMVHLGAQ